VGRLNSGITPKAMTSMGGWDVASSRPSNQDVDKFVLAENHGVMLFPCDDRQGCKGEVRLLRVCAHQGLSGKGPGRAVGQMKKFNRRSTVIEVQR